MFKIRQFKTSVFNALRGLKTAYTQGQSFRLQILAAVAAVIFGFFFGIKINEWLWILGATGVVLSLELLNSMLEKILNIVNPSHNLEVGHIKDMSAGAVLIVSIMSAIIGLIIFLPYIF